MLKRIFCIALGVFVAMTYGCDKGGGDDGKPAATDPTISPGNNPAAAGTLAISDNGLAGAYPEGLAVTAFPQAIDAAPGQAAPGTIVLGLQNPPGGNTITGADFNTHPKDKLAEDLKRLNGTADQCIGSDVIHGFEFQDYNVEVCFGFDYGIVSGPVIGTVDRGQINNVVSNNANNSTTDLKNALAGMNGLVANNSGEACMVGTSRKMVGKAAAKLEAALRLFQGVLCEAKLAGDETLPGAGETKNLTAIVAAGIPAGSAGNLSLNSVTMARKPDSGSNPVFETAIIFDVTAGQEAGSQKVIKLVHSPDAGGNSAYTGTMYILEQATDSIQNQVSQRATSMTYVKTVDSAGTQRLVFDVRSGDFNDTKESPIGADGRVDFGAGAALIQQMGAPLGSNVENGEYFVFDIDPSSYAGRISFWADPGGGTPRGFVSETTQDSTTGKLSGCAWAGADRDGSISERISAGEPPRPTGCFTPQHNNGDCGANGDNQGTQVWKQCFVQNDDGVYIIDTAQTTAAAGYDILEAAAAEVPALTITDITSPL